MTDLPRKRVFTRKYVNSEQRQEVLEAYCQFIDENDDPHAAAFVVQDPVARKYFVSKENLYDWPEFRQFTDRALAKQELYWRDKGKNGQATAMSIFVLKQPQLGYRDRFENDVTSNGEKVQFQNNLPRPAATAKKPAKKM